MFMKFFGDLAGKIMLVVSLVLLVLCFILYVGGRNKEIEITKLTNSVSELSNRNSVLESQLLNCKLQFESAMEAKQIQQDVIDKLNSSDLETLDKLNRIDLQIKEKQNENSSDLSAPLPADLARVLTDHCKRTKGSDCPNP